jgi:hypothetical protein
MTPLCVFSCNNMGSHQWQSHKHNSDDTKENTRTRFKPTTLTIITFGHNQTSRRPLPIHSRPRTLHHHPARRPPFPRIASRQTTQNDAPDKTDMTKRRERLQMPTHPPPPTSTTSHPTAPPTPPYSSSSSACPSPSPSPPPHSPTPHPVPAPYSSSSSSCLD